MLLFVEAFLPPAGLANALAHAYVHIHVHIFAGLQNLSQPYSRTLTGLLPVLSMSASAHIRRVSGSGSKKDDKVLQLV